MTLQHNILLETLNEVLRRIGELERKPARAAVSDDTGSEPNVLCSLPCKNIDELRALRTVLDTDPHARTALLRITLFKIVD